ncbi:MAG: HTH domain-containing protein [Lachnospiraceae bacterium]|nr:HTH domain-containing protein [Lachnospiraceae bacterium]
MTHTDLIMMYGFSEDEVSRAETVLPNKQAEIADVECFTDILAVRSYAVLINVSNISKTDLETFFEYYTEVGYFSEILIIVGDTYIPENLKKSIHLYDTFDSLMVDMKYLLLSAYQRNKRNETFSTTLSNAIVILSEIRKHPGVTSAQLADKLELSLRSVQRYIETLRVAGEWIEYDHALKGWKLTDGKSVLWGDW